MDADLISKKDLLQEAGISYGQLYRWKRKGLIPEDWFVRRSTFTGQETFFPRDKVLARIERIKDLKSEDVSLDDIADAVSPDLGTTSLTLAEVRERALVSPEALELFVEVCQPAEGEPLVFGEMVSLSAIDSLLTTGDVSLDEARSVLEALQKDLPEFEGGAADLIFVRRRGLATSLLVTSAAEVRFEPATRVIARLNLSECAENLSARIR